MFNRLNIICVIICTCLLTDGTAAARRVWARPIRIGVALDQTGPLGSAGRGILDGLNAYFAHLNVRGGVHGRPVKLRVYDNESSAEGTYSNIRRLVKADRVLIILGPSSYLSVAIQYARIANEVLIFPFRPFLSKPPSPNLFSLLPSYSTQAILAVDFLKEKLKKDRISIAYRDTKFGKGIKSTVAKRLKQYANEVLVEAPFPSGATDLSEIVARLISSRTEAVIVLGTARESASFLKASSRRGGKFQSLVILPLEYHYLLDLLETAGRAAEGVIFCSIFPDTHYTEAPGIKSFREIFSEYRPGIEPDVYSLMGFTFAKVLSEGIKRAESMTFNGLTKAFESLSKYDTGIVPQINFGSQDRQAYNGAYFSVIKNFKYATFYESVLLQVLLKIKSVPRWADVLEKTHWGFLGNTGKDGFFSMDVLWKPGTYLIEVRKAGRAKKKSFVVDDDPEFIEWEANLLKE